MKVLRVELEGTLTSFRHPHLHVGRQLSFTMPPPATIYGHVCSAVGEWIDPTGIQFGYIFSTAGTADDLELLHMTSAGSGRIDKAWGYSKNVEVQTNVLARQVHLHPKLILYLTAFELAEHFRSPYFPVVLGRSQDLASYRRIDIIELVQSKLGYFEDSLLPWKLREQMPTGTTVQMPRFIKPNFRHEVAWQRYIALHGRVWKSNPSLSTPKGARSTLQRDGEETVLIDPESPIWQGAHRIVSLHSWV